MNDEFEVSKKSADPLNGADRKGRAIDDVPDETTGHIDDILLFHQRKTLLATLISDHIGALMTPLQLEVISRQLQILGKSADSYDSIARELNRRDHRHRLGLSLTRRLTALDIANAEAEALAILKDNYHLALGLHHATMTDQEVRKVTPRNAKPYLM